ncbi:MAG TPA: UDP-N-acetylmuramoyl-tripeptide--D-alanyl-D-alanine ligase [Clostridia bacterium]|nr:UDP-N-acetylmuramoyl-tripeptide--D-alanyl-D-alanine ligase [Clostridia bacterium]
MKLSLSRIAEFTQASGEFEGHSVAHGYSIDSRTVQPGEIFFAVQGERLDGHDYVEAALHAGALAAIVRKDAIARFPDKTRLLAVDDTLRALSLLAAAVRRLWGKPLVGVTGSAGKTTTKDAIAHVLASRKRVLKSVGNLNNHFGMPLQLLRLEPEHDIAVIEIGMSHPGEITALAALALPDIGVVTNVGPVHLEFFGSVAEIARAKYELVASLPCGGVAVLNADDEYVSQFGRNFHGRVVTYGIHKFADVRAQNIETRGALGSAFDVIVGGCCEQATLPLVGEHNILNALAAVSVALQQGITPSDAVSSLASLAPPEKRGEVLHLCGATVVNDCYNSNPKALKAMVDALALAPASRHIVVAGEMLELGATGPDLHYECGVHMARRGVQVVVGVRGLAEHIVRGAVDAGAQATFLATPEEAGEWLAREVCKGDSVLLKASRGVRLERALDTWKARTGFREPASM